MIKNTGFKIFLWVIAIMAVIYLIGLFFCWLFLLHFKKALRKRSASFLVLFAEKKEILLSVVKEYINSGYDFDAKDLELIRQVEECEKKRLKDDEIVEIGELLNSLENRLKFLETSFPKEKRSLNHDTMIQLLKDIDNNYRRMATVYNSDLLGYNYWRKQIFYRWFFCLVGYREKQRIH